MPCHLAPSRAAERPDEASDRTRTGRNGRNGAHSENARSYPITVGKRKGTHEPPFPKNDAPEENDGTKRRYTQAAPFGPGGPKAVPSTKTATKNEKNESRPAGPAGNRHGKTRRPFCRINRQWESPRLPAGTDRRPATARTKTGTGPTGPVSRISVELEGVEPSSKQGTRRLSTCLSVISSFSPYPAYGSPIRSPVRKISPRTPGHAPQPASHCRYPDASRTRSGSCRRGTRPRTSLGTGIKVMLLSKITQRVHSYYCHLYV